MKILQELKDLIPPLTPDEFATLEKSILAEGVRDRLVVWNDTLIDGHNRYEICQKHGIEFSVQELEFDNLDQVKVWMIDNQKGRRNLTDGWKWELAQKKKALLEVKHKQERKERYVSNIDTHPGEKKSESGRTQKAIADELGWSTGKVAMADKVWKEADEKTKEEVKRGDKSINQAYKEVRKKEKKAERDANIKKAKEEIDKENTIILYKYDVIAIDPPWDYSEFGGFSSNNYDSESNRGSVDYPTMSTNELTKLDIPAKENAVIYLWTTHMFLRSAFDLLDAWNFKYKATLVWDKQKIGIGRTVRMQCEFCLLGVRGNPIIEGNSIRDIIYEPRREHSRKPEAFYKLVETMTHGKRLDYFAREQRPNWDVYGAEIDKF